MLYKGPYAVHLLFHINDIWSKCFSSVFNKVKIKCMFALIPTNTTKYKSNNMNSYTQIQYLSSLAQYPSKDLIRDGKKRLF